MTLYFVTRHPGAKEWAREVLGKEAVFLDALDTSIIRTGDEVCGVLPANLAAEVVQRGGIFRYLKMDTVPDAPRGGELSADQMRQANACLVRYDIREVLELNSASSPTWPGRLKRFLRQESVPLGLLTALIVAAIAPSGVGMAMTNMVSSDAIWVTFGTALMLLALVLIVRVRKEPSSRLVRVLVGLPGIKALAKRGWFAALAPGWSGPALVVALAGVALFGMVGLWIAWHQPEPRVGLFMSWEIVFVIFFAFGAWLGRGFLGIEIRQLPISFVPSRPVVVMFLSPLSGIPNGGSVKIEPGEDGKPVPIAVGKIPAAVLEQLGAIWAPTAPPMTLSSSTRPDNLLGQNRFPWQQNFRVLNSQFGTERRAGRVVVVTSQASAPQFSLFKAAVEHLAAKEQLELTVSELGPINPHLLSDTENALRVVIEDLRNERSADGTRRWRDEEILVDVTSGPKIASIAAATATFGSDLVFSYVEDQVVWLLDVHARFGQG